VVDDRFVETIAEFDGVHLLLDVCEPLLRSTSPGRERPMFEFYRLRRPCCSPQR
jgi:hypothetical protein